MPVAPIPAEDETIYEKTQELLTKQMPEPVEIVTTRMEMKTELLQRRPSELEVSPPETARSRQNIDPAFKFHEPSQPRIEMIDQVRQSLYDEEAKEIVSVTRFNKIPDDGTDAPIDGLTQANSGL